ncbi:MAG: hypothetical protein ACLUVC_08730 [Longibaculum sp.]
MDTKSSTELDIVEKYGYDYFFHYLLIYYDELRLFLCRYLSKDDSITSTIVINSESFKGSYEGKKLIMDVVVEDDKGRYYDFEMHNYDIELEDQIRFLRYGERLIDRQEKRGIDYVMIRPVYQMIIYTGKPLAQYQHFMHYIQKGDIERHLYYKGELIKTVLLQLQLLKEEYDMQEQLGTMQQLCYLFMYNKPHPFSELCELVKGVVAMHDKFMNSDEFLKAYDIESERLLIRSKMHRNREEGREEGLLEGREEGLLEGRIEGRINALKDKAMLLVERKYHRSSEWLQQCTSQQIEYFYELFVQDISYEELKEAILSFENK